MMMMMMNGVVSVCEVDFLDLRWRRLMMKKNIIMLFF